VEQLGHTPHNQKFLDQKNLVMLFANKALFIHQKFFIHPIESLNTYCT